jgi:hypothetical protein
MNITVAIAVAIVIAVTSGAAGYGYARSNATTTATTSCMQAKPTGPNDAERRFLDVPDRPTTGHARF